MASNVPFRRPGVLANNENRAALVNNNINKTKDAQRPQPSRNQSGVFSSSNGISGIAAGIRNKTFSSLSATARGLSIKTTNAREEQKIVLPEDWIIVPQRKPLNCYNIDTDLESYLMCPGLAAAQYNYLMRVEGTYMAPAGFLSHTRLSTEDRFHMVNWMTQVHRQYAEQQESLFLAVNFFDRFLALRPGGSSIIANLPGLTMAQRVAATALYLSTKYEEIYGLSIEQICNATEAPRASAAEIRRVEFDMLRALKFKINSPLLNHFLRRCSKAAGATALLHSLGKYLIEISLYDPDLATGTKSSLVAAACSYIAIKVFGERTKMWDETMKYYSGGYTEEDLLPIASKLLTVHRTIQATNTSMLVKVKWEDMVKHQAFVEFTRTTDL